MRKRSLSILGLALTGALTACGSGSQGVRTGAERQNAPGASQGPPTRSSATAAENADEAGNSQNIQVPPVEK